MSIRTDLIAEIKAEKPDNITGLETYEEQLNDVTISTVYVTDDIAAKTIKKPKGCYCTISFPRLDFICDTNNITKAIVKSLKSVCKTKNTSVLVVGLGNTDITPDALGPFVADRILATRHISDNLKHSLGLQNLKSVCCLAPNVLGKTGIESYDLIKASVNTVKPDTVIVIDALAARDAERLCRTIQISDSGITAGSGVNNARKTLNRENLGVPVIAVGVPTVIDGNSFFETKENMMVTPKEIDLLIEKASDIISRAINIFLQPEVDINIIESLT